MSQKKSLIHLSMVLCFNATKDQYNLFFSYQTHIVIAVVLVLKILMEFYKERGYFS